MKEPPTTDDIEISSQHKRVITISATMLVLAGGLNCGWVGPLLPSLTSAHNLSLVDGGFLVSAGSAGSILAMALAKELVQRFGVKSCMLAGTVALALSFAAIGTLPVGMPPLLAAMFVLGFGMGITGVSGNLAVLRMCDAHTAASTLNKLHLFFGAGAMLGPLIAGAAMTTPASYRIVYVGAGVMSAALAAYLQRIPEHKNTAVEETTAARPVWRSIPLWLFGLVLFTYVGIECGLGTWLFTFLLKVNQMKESQASVCMSLLWVGLSLGRLVSIRLCGRVEPTKITTMAMILTIFMLSILASGELVAPLTMAIVICTGMGFGPIYPNTLADASTTFKRSGSAVPILITCGALGAIVFPSLIGEVLAHWGPLPALMTLAGSATILLVMFLLLSASKKTLSDDARAGTG